MEVCDSGVRQGSAKQIHKIGNICFYTALFIELIIVIIDKSNYTLPFEGKIFQFTFLLFFIKALLTQYSRKEWLLMFAFGILGAVSYFSTGRNEIIRLVMMIAAARDISLRTVMKCTFYTTLSGVSLLILLSITGIYGKLYMIANFRDRGEELRYCLGLGHPNALHCMVWALIVLVIYLYIDSMKWYHYIGLAAVNVGFFLLTDSKTGVAVTFVTLLLAVLLKYQIRLRESNWIYLAGIGGFLAVILFSVVAAIPGINSKILNTIDKLVTNRISLLSKTPLTSWSAFSDPTHELYMDMGFVRLFDWYGYIPALVFCFVICLIIWNCCVKKKYAEFIVVMSFVVYTVFEAHAISVYLARNYMLMMLIGNWSQVFHVEGKERFYLWGLRAAIKRKQI